MAEKPIAAAAAAALLWSGPVLAAADPAPFNDLANAATSAVVDELRKPVLLRVGKNTVARPWAFVYAEMREPDGRPIDYRGTPFAAAAEHGGKSAVYAGLFHEEAGGWRVVAQAVGPTDMAWDGWDREYGAPRSVFQIPTD